MVCTKDLRKDCKEWTEWFRNTKVPNDAKLDQLHYRNSEGYSVLHYAALHYRPDILSVALDTTGGTTMQLHTHIVFCVHVHVLTYMYRCTHVHVHVHVQCISNWYI